MTCEGRRNEIEEHNAWVLLWEWLRYDPRHELNSPNNLEAMRSNPREADTDLTQ